MRKLWALFFLASLLAACGASRLSETKALAAERRAEQVADSLHAGSYTVIFDYVVPHRMPPRHLTSTYSLRILGDSIESHLPYFGVAYRAGYDAGRVSPLVFTGHIDHYRLTAEKKGNYTITFSTRHHSELMEYQLDVFGNGRATLQVHSSDRESISFNGEMQIND